jgi:hypothetical protein
LNSLQAITLGSGTASSSYAINQVIERQVPLSALPMSFNV